MHNNHRILLADFERNRMITVLICLGNRKVPRLIFLQYLDTYLWHAQFENILDIFSSCECHTLNLCGHDATESVMHTLTYYGKIQTNYYVFFSKSKKMGYISKTFG